MDDLDGQLRPVESIASNTSTVTVFTLLPAEIITQIYLHASLFPTPIILPPNLPPSYNIDLRFLHYNHDSTPYYHSRCLTHALRHNTFTILPYNINQYASPTLSEIQSTFSRHDLFFQHVRNLRLRLRAPLNEWPERAEALKQQERYSKWFLECGFLHRFRQLEACEFEHMVCLRDWVDGAKRDHEEGIEIWRGSEELVEACGRAGIGRTVMTTIKMEVDAAGQMIERGVMTTTPPEIRFVFDRITKFRAVDRHHVVWVRRELVRGFAGLVRESTSS